MGRKGADEAKVEEMVGLLNHLDIDRSLGRPKVREALKAAGHKPPRDTLLGMAIQRRNVSVLPVPKITEQVPENDLFPNIGNRSGTGPHDE